MVTTERLLRIVKQLSLLTDEDSDRMFGVYIDAQGVVRAKGSTLGLIEDARLALKDAGWQED